MTVWEPTGYAAAVFSDALGRHGVRVTGSPRPGRATPPGATPLASHNSMPLKELLLPFMKLSNNMHAETLTKTIGYETSGRGTWDAGLAAISGYLEKEGVKTYHRPPARRLGSDPDEPLPGRTARHAAAVRTGRPLVRRLVRVPAGRLQPGPRHGRHPCSGCAQRRRLSTPVARQAP